MQVGGRPDDLPVGVTPACCPHSWLLELSEEMADETDPAWFLSHRKVDKVPGIPVPVAYTGNGDYCYAHCLHMTLLATGTVQPQDLPTVGFIECLTTVPFGKLYLDLADGPVSYFSNAIADPNTGLTIAIQTMGWTCQYHSTTDAERALHALREAVKYQPVLVGPVDMGYLTYNPHHRYLGGADHYVLVIGVNDVEGTVLLHDPKMFPYATLPTADFVRAWRAEKIQYCREPFVFRSHFKMVERPARSTMVTRTLDIVRKQLLQQYAGPTMFSGAEAVRRTATSMDKPGIRTGFAPFTLPLAARRAIDASNFLHSAGLQVAATAMASQAQLYGRSLYLAVQERWDDVAKIISDVAELEVTIEKCLLNL